MLVVLGGCSEDVAARRQQLIENANNENIKRVVSLYLFFGAKHFRNPGSEEELRKFTQSGRADLMLKRFDLKAESFDQYLVSDKDGRPFHVFYGMPYSEAPDHNFPLVADSSGVGEIRRVVYANREEKRIEGADAFKELLEQAKTQKRKSVKRSD